MHKTEFKEKNIEMHKTVAKIKPKMLKVQKRGKMNGLGAIRDDNTLMLHPSNVVIQHTEFINNGNIKRKSITTCPSTTKNGVKRKEKKNSESLNRVESVAENTRKFSNRVVDDIVRVEKIEPKKVTNKFSHIKTNNDRRQNIVHSNVEICQQAHDDKSNASLAKGVSLRNMKPVKKSVKNTEVFTSKNKTFAAPVKFMKNTSTHESDINRANSPVKRSASNSLDDANIKKIKRKNNSFSVKFSSKQESKAIKNKNNSSNDIKRVNSSNNSEKCQISPNSINKRTVALETDKNSSYMSDDMELDLEWNSEEDSHALVKGEEYHSDCSSLFDLESDNTVMQVNYVKNKL